MEKKAFLYDGKTKQIYSTEHQDQIIIHYKDDAIAFNGIKKASIQNKGILNNYITEIVFNHLHQQGVKSHFIKRLNSREQLCQKLDIIPLEIIVRNYVAGSMAKRLDMNEGNKLSNVIIELRYKNHDLGDPFINQDHAIALGIITYEEMAVIEETTRKINEILIHLFQEVGIILVDFKIEFGKTKDQEIILADEISPDSGRYWDEMTLEKLDKDRFRRDLGSVEGAYQEILERLNSRTIG